MPRPLWLNCYPVPGIRSGWFFINARKTTTECEPESEGVAALLCVTRKDPMELPFLATMVEEKLRS